MPSNPIALMHVSPSKNVINVLHQLCNYYCVRIPEDAPIYLPLSTFLQGLSDAGCDAIMGSSGQTYRHTALQRTCGFVRRDIVCSTNNARWALQNPQLVAPVLLKYDFLESLRCNERGVRFCKHVQHPLVSNIVTSECRKEQVQTQVQKPFDVNFD